MGGSFARYQTGKIDSCIIERVEILDFHLSKLVLECLSTTFHSRLKAQVRYYQLAIYCLSYIYLNLKYTLLKRCSNRRI